MGIESRFKEAPGDEWRLKISEQIGQVLKDHSDCVVGKTHSIPETGIHNYGFIDFLGRDGQWYRLEVYDDKLEENGVLHHMGREAWVQKIIAGGSEPVLRKIYSIGLRLGISSDDLGLMSAVAYGSDSLHYNPNTDEYYILRDDSPEGLSPAQVLRLITNRVAVRRPNMPQLTPQC